MLDVTATLERPLGSPPPDPRAEVEAHDDDLRARLVPDFPSSGWRGWIGPLVVTALAFFLRIWHISTPRAFSFDETYYAKDAWSLLHFGYERQPIPNADRLFLTGNGHIYGTGAEWATHPPLGKWVIAVGEKIFGISPFGFRIMAVRLRDHQRPGAGQDRPPDVPLGPARHPGGLLLAIDGLAIVMSRTSMLDIFLMAFVLFAFACLVIDRDKVRARLLDWSLEAWTSTRRPSASPPGARPVARRPAVAAHGGVLPGLRLRDQVERRLLPRRLRDHVLAVGPIGPAGGRHRGSHLGRRRQGLLDERDLLRPDCASPRTSRATPAGSSPGAAISAPGPRRPACTRTIRGSPDVVRSFWHWHAVTLNYHNHLFSPHAYEAGPGKWILMIRPTQMYAVYPKCPSNPAVDCARDIVSLGNPILWWTAAPPCCGASGCSRPGGTGAPAPPSWAWPPAGSPGSRTSGARRSRRTRSSSCPTCLALVIALAAVIGPPRASAVRRTVGARSPAAGCWSSW